MINTLRINFRILTDWHEQNPAKDEVIPVFSSMSIQASTFLEFFHTKRAPWTFTFSPERSFAFSHNHGTRLVLKPYAGSILP